MRDLVNWRWNDERLINLPLVMLNKTNYAFVLGRLDERLVILQCFCGGLGDQYMHPAPDGIQSDGVMRSWRILRYKKEFNTHWVTHYLE